MLRDGQITAPMDFRMAAVAGGGAKEVKLVGVWKATMRCRGCCGGAHAEHHGGDGGLIG